MLTILPKILKWTEIIALILTLCGYVFKVLYFPGANEMLMIGLLTLAATYFLSAFPVQPAANEAKPQGLVDTLMIVLPKVMFIAGPVCALGGCIVGFRDLLSTLIA